VTLDQIELWFNTKLLIIDEISFATDNNIKNIEKKLRQLKANSNIYGGIHIIFCGDMRQLEPVEGPPLYKITANSSGIFLTHMNCYIEFNGIHRFNHDLQWGHLLLRFRNGIATPADIQTINTKVQNKNNKMPGDIKYVTYLNKDRDAINTAIFQDRIEYFNNSFNNTNIFIMIFCDRLEYKRNEVYIPVRIFFL
jgi:hypothetical protein